MLDCLIQSNSARKTTTASTRQTRYQYEPPYSGAPGSSKFQTVAPPTTSGYSPDMVTRATWTSHRQPPTPYLNTRHWHWGRNTFSQQKQKAEYSQTSDVIKQYENIINAITTLLNRLQATITNHKLLHTQVPTFRGNKDRLNEFEHLLRNQLWPFKNRLTEKAELRNFQSTLREVAIQFFQSLTISTETTLTDVLDKFRKEFNKDNLKEVVRYKGDQANYDPTLETFSDFLKRQKVIAKHALLPDFPVRETAHQHTTGPQKQR